MYSLSVAVKVTDYALDISNLEQPWVSQSCSKRAEPDTTGNS